MFASLVPIPFPSAVVFLAFGACTRAACICVPDAYLRLTLVSDARFIHVDGTPGAVHRTRGRVRPRATLLVWPGAVQSNALGFKSTLRSRLSICAVVASGESPRHSPRRWTTLVRGFTHVSG